MESKKPMEQLIELSDRRSDQHLAWTRHILTLASGGLALLAGMGPEVPDLPVARYLMAATWVFLGLGILCGSASTYAATARTARLATELASHIRAGRTAAGTPIVAKPSKFYPACQYVMVASLLLAVVSLVGVSVMRTLL